MRALITAFFVCLFATPAAADRYFLTFEGAALGVAPLGGITVDADVAQDSYIVRATLRSGGLLNFFERTHIRASSTGEIRSGAVFWRTYELDHQYSEKRRSISMRTADNGMVIAQIVPNYRLWGTPPTTAEQRQRSRDPLSTMMAMSVDVGQSRRCSGAYPTFDGRFHYLLELGGGEIDRFRGGGYDGEVLKCSLSYIAVAGFEARDAGRRRIPRGEIWFGLAPGSRFAPVVRIETPWPRRVVIRLTQFRRAEVDVAQ